MVYAHLRNHSLDAQLAHFPDPPLGRQSVRLARQSHSRETASRTTSSPSLPSFHTISPHSRQLGTAQLCITHFSVRHIASWNAVKRSGNGHAGIERMSKGKREAAPPSWLSCHPDTLVTTSPVEITYSDTLHSGCLPATLALLRRSTAR